MWLSAWSTAFLLASSPQLWKSRNTRKATDFLPKANGSVWQKRSAPWIMQLDNADRIAVVGWKTCRSGIPQENTKMNCRYYWKHLFMEQRNDCCYSQASGIRLWYSPNFAHRLLLARIRLWSTTKVKIKIFPDTPPAIISRELLQMAQDRREKTICHPSRSHKYLFGDYLYCMNCHVRMHGRRCRTKSENALLGKLHERNESVNKVKLFVQAIKKYDAVTELTPRVLSDLLNILKSENVKTWVKSCLSPKGITQFRYFSGVSASFNWKAEFKKKVQSYLNAETPTISVPFTKQLYRVRKSWADAKSQLGAYSSLENAKKVRKVGYSVFDANGNLIYTNGGKFTKGQFWKLIVKWMRPILWTRFFRLMITTLLKLPSSPKHQRRKFRNYRNSISKCRNDLWHGCKNLRYGSWRRSGCRWFLVGGQHVLSLFE